MRFKSLVCLLVATGCCPALAQQTPPPDPCADPRTREFDFWIGDWDVFIPNGKLAGTNRIDRLYGCVLHEYWKTPKMEGQSFNRFDPDRGVWHQTWIDSMGSLLLIEGGMKDGAMVMTDGRGNEIRWSRNDDGTIRQHWRATKDGGKTWETVFDGKYVRSSRPQPK